jgi:LAO/AO transport system kinase
MAERTSAPNLDALLAGVRAGERRSLAKLITRIENGEYVDEVRRRLSEHPRKRSLTVGVTGSPGAGKSSLSAALVSHLRAENRTVAVLACDPSSPFSGGALLGDRVRIDHDPADSGVFVRSFSTRGSSGGISDSASDVLQLVNAFGFDVVLIETVGSGQDQLAIRDLVDVLVLVLTPAGGDDIQWEKAGQMEAADVVALNKADLPGADFALAGIRSMLELSPSPPPPIVRTVATNKEGIAELWSAIEKIAEEGARRPHLAAAKRLIQAGQRELRRWFESAEGDPEVQHLIERFAAGGIEAPAAAAELIRRLASAGPA